MKIKKLDIYLEKIKEKLGNNPDIVTKIISAQEKNVGFIYFKSMVNEENFINGLLKPIRETKEKITTQSLEENILNSIDISSIEKEKEVVEKLLINNVVLLIENEDNALAIDLEDFQSRTPSEPPTSAVILGPREGFTESIKTNLTLIRRRLHSDKLKIEDLNVGTQTGTRVSLCYLSNIADKAIVKKIKTRIKNINIDGILDAHYLISFLSERPNSMFKQVGSSEKPDIIAAKMLEGRIAILVDNTPIVLTLPFMLIEDLQNSNDYYTTSQYVTFIRAVRAIGIIVAAIAPSVYLALRLYHYKVLPIQFIITISSSTQALPFSPVIEMIFILIMFQILYEVSLRLPRYLGLATSIVGALILGDTGVKAGLISPPGVIIIAMSIISIYVIPDQAPQLTLLRAIFLVIGSTLGLFGVVGGMVFFINHMAVLDSYGTPYLAPYAPRINDDIKDAISRVPIVWIDERPKALNPKNKVRLKK